jgi:hypothetical protein
MRPKRAVATSGIALRARPAFACGHQHNWRGKPLATETVRSIVSFMTKVAASQQAPDALLDEPAVLPCHDSDDLDEGDRERLHAALDAADASFRRGEGVPIDVALAELDALVGG